MPLEAPDEGWVWVTVPLDRALEVTVIGECHTWYTHWVKQPGERRPVAVRCVLTERGSCDWCRAQYDRRARYVLPVDVDGQVRALELGRVQYPALAGIEEFGGLLGARIVLARERPVRNAPIGVRLACRVQVPMEQRRDVSGLVAALGMVQLRLLDCPASGPGVAVGGNSVDVTREIKQRRA